jgi:cytochrome c oxidase cbb3-type subunit 2
MSWHKHEVFEKNALILAIVSLVVVSIGGLVQIVPLFYLESTIEKVSGVRPYTPLELAGRNIYVREGCYLCHSQMIRPLRDEVERYGHYSLAAESQYDHPFQWGSKRTGPDLARVGGKYSDEWHKAHMITPRQVVPGSVMPGYPFLATTPLKDSNIAALNMAEHLRTSAIVGVPYTEAMIANADADIMAQVDPDSDGVEGLIERYGEKVNIRNFDGMAGEPTELDAIIAYLQVLGTMVDFRLDENRADIKWLR